MNTFKACLTLLKHHIDSYIMNSKCSFKNYYINTGKFQGKDPFITSLDSTKPSTCQKMIESSGPLLWFSGIGYSCTKADIESKNESASNENKG